MIPLSPPLPHCRSLQVRISSLLYPWHSVWLKVGTCCILVCSLIILLGYGPRNGIIGLLGMKIQNFDTYDQIPFHKTITSFFLLQTVTVFHLCQYDHPKGREIKGGLSNEWQKQKTWNEPLNLVIPGITIWNPVLEGFCALGLFGLLVALSPSRGSSGDGSSSCLLGSSFPAVE